MNVNLQEDEYRLFKEKLEKFVKNSAKNAEAKRTKLGSFPVTEIDLFGIGGIVLSMQYHKMGQTCGPKSTYINSGWFNIVCEFDDNYEIIGFKCALPDNAASDIHIKVFDKTTQLCEDCCELWTKKELGLNDGEEPNKNIKRFLEQYMTLHNEYRRLTLLYPFKDALQS
jgi:hypothetical protein